jgi:KTSC domain
VVLREVVTSSSLRSIGYDRKAQTLEVEFKNGGVYRYSEVPLELWMRLQKSTSKGKFFQEHVRDRFPTARL